MLIKDKNCGRRTIIFPNLLVVGCNTLHHKNNQRKANTENDPNLRQKEQKKARPDCMKWLYIHLINQAGRPYWDEDSEDHVEKTEG